MTNHSARTLWVILGLAAIAALSVLLVVRLGRTPALVAQPEPREPVASAPAAPVAAAVSGDARPGFAESLGIQILALSEGDFWMGSPLTAPKALQIEQPEHRVHISAGRGLSAHEVTVGQFRRFVTETGYQTEAEATRLVGGVGLDPQGQAVYDRRYTWRNPGFPQTDDHPVVNVTWVDAEAFCLWLTRTDGRTYRLPTEAEWEYACRAGRVTLAVAGVDVDQLDQVGNLADASLKTKFPAWANPVAGNDLYPLTAPVGTFPGNPWGFHDMVGNVWEWCFDAYIPDFYKRSPEVDPLAAGPSLARAIRGGGWDTPPGICSTTIRSGSLMESCSNSLGFRIARVLVGR